MALPQTIRYPIFFFLILFPFIAMCINAHLISVGPGTYYYSKRVFVHPIDEPPPRPLFDFKGVNKLYEKLGVSVSILTLITIITFLVLDRKAKPRPTIALEVTCLGVLWVMWTVVLGLAGSQNCDIDSIYFSDILSCPEVHGALAFTVLVWLIILTYLGILITFSIIAKNRGNHAIWESRVPQADFNPGAATAGVSSPQPTSEQLREKQAQV